MFKLSNATFFGFHFLGSNLRIAKTRMIGSQQRRLRCGEAKMKTIKMMRRRMTKTRRQRVAVVCHQVYILPRVSPALQSHEFVHTLWPFSFKVEGGLRAGHGWPAGQNREGGHDLRV